MNTRKNSIATIHALYSYVNTCDESGGQENYTNLKWDKNETYPDTLLFVIVNESPHMLDYHRHSVSLPVALLSHCSVAPGPLKQPYL